MPGYVKGDRILTRRELTQRIAEEQRKGKEFVCWIAWKNHQGKTDEFLDRVVFASSVYWMLYKDTPNNVTIWPSNLYHIPMEVNDSPAVLKCCEGKVELTFWEAKRKTYKKVSSPLYKRK